MIKLSYRIIRFPHTKSHDGTDIGTRYVGLAWSYEHAYMRVTDAEMTYTDARNMLDNSIVDYDARLHYFDGEYECDGNDMLWPVKDPHDVVTGKKAAVK